MNDFNREWPDIMNALDLDWPDIVPLRSFLDPAEQLPYPFDHLPEALKCAAAETSRFCQVPRVAPAVVGLAVAAVALGKIALVVEKPGLEHYASMFWCLISESGTRKSAIFKTMTSALNRYALDRQVNYQQEINETRARNAAVDIAIKKTRADAQKYAWTIDQTTAAIVCHEGQRKATPPNPRLYTSDCTEPRLFQKMAHRNGVYAVMSGEGRPVLDNIMGRFSGETQGDSLYLAAISGDVITRDRVGSEGIPEELIIHHPSLTVCVMVQADKFMQMCTHPALRGAGTIARIWPCWLESNFGQRLEAEDDEGLNATQLNDFEELILNILQKREQNSTDPHRVVLSKEAAKARRNHHNSIEVMQAPGNSLEDVRAVSSKCVSQTCKLALVLHVLDDPGVLDQEESVISEACWYRAESMGTYHLSEAARSQRYADESANLEPARRVLQWLKKERKDKATLSSSLLMQYGPSPRMSGKECGEVLSLLEDHGYLREVSSPQARKPVYEVNPLCLA